MKATPLPASTPAAAVGFTVFDVAERLREHGWIVPAYRLAPACSHVAVLRLVVREGLSRDMADKLLQDLRAVVRKLRAPPGRYHADPARAGHVLC